MSGFRTQLSVPLGATTRPAVPGTIEAAGRRLIEVHSSQPVTRELLDALGLPGWLIVSPARSALSVEIGEPRDEHLWRLHQPPAAEPAP